MTCMIANTFSMMMDVLRSIFGKQDIPSNWTTSGCWSPGVTGLHLGRSEKWERGVLCCSWFFYFFRIGFRFGFLKNDRITKWSGYRSMKLNCSMCEDLINIIGELKAPGTSKASIIFVVLEGTMLIQQSKQNLSGILMKTIHCVRQAGAGGWSWNGVREKHCYLAGAGDWSWNDVRKKYCRLEHQPNSRTRWFWFREFTKYLEITVMWKIP